ncbi:hypothetical protein AB0395_30970 [Streptosporangium sp. NPDC051023]|uniref:hypothetical protein n=1 Tax=Streptosporangium sp. NPDC051023 TaxID=3155410 RepID=UPI00344ED1F6
MSKQTTFTLTFLAGLSVIVPGCAGYLSARMDAVERAHRELVSLESRIRQEQLTAPAREADGDRNETVAVPGTVLCDMTPRSRQGDRREPRAAALARASEAPESLPRSGSGARRPASEGAGVAAGQEEAGRQSQNSDHEHRRRHRENREQAGASECETASETPSPSSSPTDEGSTTDGEVSDPSQAEAPVN